MGPRVHSSILRTAPEAPCWDSRSHLIDKETEAQRSPGNPPPPGPTQMGPFRGADTHIPRGQAP